MMKQILYRNILAALGTWTFIVPQCEAIYMSPPSGTCWSNLSEIALTEISAIFNPSIPLSIQRTYILCSMTYDIGNLDMLTGLLLDGQHPILPFNPNIHIKCVKDDNSCILSGGQFQVFTLNESLLSSILPSLPLHGFGLPSELPEDHSVDISNLLIEGIVFQNSIPVSYGSNIRLTTPGQNIVFRDCTWQGAQTNIASDSQQEWAISMNVVELGHPYLPDFISVTIKNSVFKDLRKTMGIIGAFPSNIGNGLFEVNVEGCLFTNNSAPSIVEISNSNSARLKRSCFTNNHAESHNLLAMYNATNIEFMDLFEQGNTFTNSDLFCASSKDASFGMLSLTRDEEGLVFGEKKDLLCKIAFEATSCIRESSDDDDEQPTIVTSPPKVPTTPAVGSEKTSESNQLPVFSLKPTSSPISETENFGNELTSSATFGFGPSVNSSTRFIILLSALVSYC